MKDTIFIQIASYRDKELFPTIRRALEQAENPSRLSFGICCQDELSAEEQAFLDSVPRCRIIYIHPQDSKGCCYARSLTQSLWQGEAYTLQIDSHSRFVKEWDRILLEQLHQCPSPKPLITAYCPDYESSEDSDACSYTLSADYFNSYGMLMLIAQLPIHFYRRPVRGAFLSGHFLFASSRWIKEVPYDPHLYFHGEEITLAVRSWTHGWDIFYPEKPTVFHLYQRTNHPENNPEDRICHWNEHSAFWKTDVVAQRRCRILLGMEKDTADFGIYGLGTARTLADYETFSGVNFRLKQLDARASTGFVESEPPALEDMPPRRTPKDDNHRVLCVTAFKNLKREEWVGFQRSEEDYVTWFRNLAALSRLNLVCYCESGMQKKLQPFFQKTVDLDIENTFYGKYGEREKEIMESETYRTLIKHRALHPEHRYWEYTLMTHNKVSFLHRATRQFPGYTHYVWLDFGGLRYPIDGRMDFDWSSLTDNLIHLQAFSTDLSRYQLEPAELCAQSPALIAAAMIVVPATAMEWFALAYEEELKHYQALGIADDEQNLLVQLVRKYPERFKLEQVHFWYDLLERIMCRPE
ncbi:MAG: hypothetical protein LUI85_13890 [Bacteroides sp.]|nr:hypothetical protein [Bacteroides sp.]